METKRFVKAEEAIRRLKQFFGIESQDARRGNEELAGKLNLPLTVISLFSFSAYKNMRTYNRLMSAAITKTELTESFFYETASAPSVPKAEKLAVTVAPKTEPAVMTTPKVEKPAVVTVPEVKPVQAKPTLEDAFAEIEREHEARLKRLSVAYLVQMFSQSSSEMENRLLRIAVKCVEESIERDKAANSVCAKKDTEMDTKKDTKKDAKKDVNKDTKGKVETVSEKTAPFPRLSGQERKDFVKKVVEMLEAGVSRRRVMRDLGVGKTTFYKYLKLEGIDVNRFRLTPVHKANEGEVFEAVKEKKPDEKETELIEVPVAPATLPAQAGKKTRRGLQSGKVYKLTPKLKKSIRLYIDEKIGYAELKSRAKLSDPTLKKYIRIVEES